MIISSIAVIHTDHSDIPKPIPLLIASTVTHS